MCLLLGGSALPTKLRAQAPLPPTTSKPTPIESMATVVIGAMFMVDPAQPILVESPSSVDRCAPLTCFRGGLSVRSNQRWQLQISVAPTGGVDAPLTWLPFDAPELALSATWQTVASGASATSGTDIMLRVGVGGPSSQRPSASLLSTALRYRIIPLP